MNVPRQRRYPMRPFTVPPIPTCDNCGRPANDYWHKYRGCPVYPGLWQQTMTVNQTGTYTFTPPTWATKMTAEEAKTTVLATLRRLNELDTTPG